jgi:hypothetical protein
VERTTVGGVSAVFSNEDALQTQLAAASANFRTECCRLTQSHLHPMISRNKAIISACSHIHMEWALNIATTRPQR